MGRLVNALIGAAGDTLLSASKEAAEARKYEAIAAIREQYAQNDHERSLQLENMRQGHNMANTAYADELARNRDSGDLITAEQGLFVRQGSELSPLEYNGQLLTPEASKRREYLDPNLKALQDEYEALIGKDFQSPEDVARIQQLRGHLDQARGFNAPQPATPAQSGATREQKFHRALTTMMQDIESGALSRERAQQSIDNNPNLSPQEKAAAKTTLGLGEQEEPKPEAPKTPKTTAEATKPATKTKLSPDSGKASDLIRQVQGMDSEIRAKKSMLSGFQDQNGAAAKRIKQQIADMEKEIEKIKRSDSFRTAQQQVKDSARQRLNQ